MYRFTEILFISVCISASSGSIYDVNSEEYEKMPPKFFMDPYESCLSQPEGLYCSMNLTLVSDTPSDLLKQIIEYSSHSLRHFNYSNLYRGVCVTKKCKKYYLNTNNRNADLRATLEGCLNDILWTDYQLKAKITDEIFCYTANNDMSIEDTDITVAVICLTLVLANVVGSLYDFLFTNGNDGVKLLLCFSLRQNWSKMVAATADGPDLRIKRLKGLIGLRTMFTFLVVAYHSLYIHGFCIENPRFIEKTYDSIASYLVYNGIIVVQIFFIISGLLFAFNLQIYAERQKLTWVAIPKGILAGIIRLTPPYAVVLALICTWMRFAGSGPMWDKFIVAEINDCRRYWWSHIGYFSNYIEGSHCIIQSWYIAADFQMYCLSLIIFCIFQSNRSRKIILSVLLLAGVLIPGIQTYVQDLDGILLLTPEYPINFVSNKVFNTVYRNTHTNFACYVIGLGLGFWVYHLQSNSFDLQKYKKYTFAYWALFPACVVIVLSGCVFHADEAQPPVLLRAVYAGLSKPVFGVLVAGIILGMIFKLENFYRGILEWRGWTTVGRVSYCAYLLHFTLIRYVLGIRTSIVRTTFVAVVETNLYILVLSYVAAFPLFLLVESPTRQLIKVILGEKGKENPQQKKKEKNKKTEEMSTKK